MCTSVDVLKIFPTFIQPTKNLPATINLLELNSVAFQLAFLSDKRDKFVICSKIFYPTKIDSVRYHKHFLWRARTNISSLLFRRGRVPKIMKILQKTFEVECCFCKYS